MTADITLPSGKSLAFDIPEGWALLSPKQFEAAVAAVSDAHFTFTSHRRLAVAFGIPRKIAAKMTWEELRAVSEPSGISESLPEFPEWKTRAWICWVKPKAAIQNIIADQFCFADMAVRQIFDTNPVEDPKAFDKALNSLWASTHRIRFIPWTKTTAKLTTTLARLVPRRRKLAAAYNFLSVQRWMKLAYPKAHKKGKGGKGRDFGWPGAFVGLAGEKFGTTRQVRRSLVMDVFIHLEQQAETAERMERASQ